MAAFFLCLMLLFPTRHNTVALLYTYIYSYTLLRKVRPTYQHWTILQNTPRTC